MRKRACDSCHRRKIQCDGAVPQCNWCKHHSMTCTFHRATKVKKRVAATRAGSEKDLIVRLDRIEQALHAARQSQDAGKAQDGQTSSAAPLSVETDPPANNGIPETRRGRDYDSSVQASNATAGKMHFAGFYLGDIGSHNGIPFFSQDGQDWIRSRAGEDASFQALFAMGPLWQTQHSVPIFLDFPQQNSGGGLPDRTVVEEFLAHFRTSHFFLTFPLIDHVLFLDTIDLAYHPPQGASTLQVVTAKACVFAFLAIVSLFQSEWKSTPEIDGEACVAAAQSLMATFMQNFNINALQTLFMLTLFHMFCGHLQQGSMFHSAACRILFMLGAHLEQGKSHAPGQSSKTGRDGSWHVRNQARRIFWLAYKLDKDISLRTGQPPCIDDEHCDLTLPPADWWTRSADDRDGASPSFLDEATITSALQPDSLQLTIIKSKTCRRLYSISALKKGDAELLRDIRELDDELESWRMSVPPSYRPTLTFPRGKVVVRNGRLGMEEIILHFEYHYLMAMIHRASGRCRCWASGESSGLEGVSSSQALSVQASRSTLHFLRAAIHGVEQVAFWLVVFYPMSAILEIFCNLLLHPLHPQSAEDLELLKSVPVLIEGLRTRNLTEKEVAHVKTINDFVAELTRLGKCAMVKERQEQQAA
ncbi:fungal-specific transcription factor domain-containing protein [Colletotrichum navitas]|uniref:Fungal-specific transcription factor domain-containing protein n=1 Tax=Colletotrichum navitas TaxID=681940 RepID=A0AAD8PNT2_9PEZI|nr:fungal-specific transcription factor domain-containing protein [Colletotrichum navitas]KAK1572870.1 fungal-specific transcription factor domain-containing protein [Colletotrichum navitas]